ncbi:hypothetical protein Glove_10g22 [Diversispora epigaea]|uniref:G-protein coupled receptors family 1 profile domain-containing protein n=1 Tax=Diversispora epigaea TaxID=1348612 RepID=A0A397JN57_9GLOM|nr:hypothetical protein Glove_10g22 [Diversispora epigaea]
MKDLFYILFILLLFLRYSQAAASIILTSFNHMDYEYSQVDKVRLNKLPKIFQISGISYYVVTSLNLIGSFIVIYSCIFRLNLRKDKGKTAYMALKVPMYFAFAELLSLSIYLIYVSIKWKMAKKNEKITCSKYLLDNVQCGVKMIYIFLAVCIAILTWLRVCRGLNIDLGKYDYKLLMIIIVIPTIYTILRVKIYGISMECDDSRTKIWSIENLIEISLFLIICLYCYICILYEIKKTQAMTEIILDNDQIRKSMRQRVYRKVSGYILIFVIQSIVIIVLNVTFIFKITGPWVVFTFNIFTNFSGIGNFFQYIINEGWTNKSLK